MAVVQLKVGEQTYLFDIDEGMKVGNLKRIKQWFPDLGTNNAFTQAFFMGDPDAAVCAVWLARQQAGETEVPEPNQLPDFSLVEWIQPAPSEEGAEGEEANPTTSPADSTPDSTRTSTASDDVTSESLP